MVRYRERKRERKLEASIIAPKRPWMDLTQELLSIIADILLTAHPLDLSRFKSVCKSWYSSSLHLSVASNNTFLSPLLPLRIPKPFRHRHQGFDEYDLSVTTIFALRHGNESSGSNPYSSSSTGTPSTWLLFVNECIPGVLTIRKPFIREDFDLPLDFPRELNLIDIDASEVGRFYNLSCASMQRRKFDNKRKVNKVVLFSNGSGFIVLSKYWSLLRLRLARDGNNDVVVDSEWKHLHFGSEFRIDDMVDYKGRILAIDRRARVYECSYNSRELNAVGGTIRGGGGRRKRLIEPSGLLYLVVRWTSEEVIDYKYKAYVLDEKTMKWIEVASIDDRVFFFGDEFAFSASAEDLGGSFEKNCIVFSESSFKTYATRGSDGSYLFTRSRSSALRRVGVYHLEDEACLRPIDAYPRYSNTLWPPPNWLSQNNK